MNFESHGDEINPKIIKLGSKILSNSIILGWGEFLSKFQEKSLSDTLQYLEEEHEVLKTVYCIWFEDGKTVYSCLINEEENYLDVSTFETYYKSNSNQILNPLTKDHTTIVKAESRPLNTTTCFTGAGDNDTGIGEGKRLVWDFSTGDDIIEAPEGYKRKRLEFNFLDSVWVKEGTIYYHNAPKGCYLDMYVVCPTGQYYLDNSGTPQLAEEDTPVSHYVIKHPLQGSVPMGDELNTESCSEELPPNYKLWIEITTANSDEVSNGACELELYRARTEIL